MSVMGQSLLNLQARELGKLRCAVIPVIGTLLAGGDVAAGSAVGIAWVLGASDSTLLSIAPKSVTAPIHGHRRPAVTDRRAGHGDRRHRSHQREIRSQLPEDRRPHCARVLHRRRSPRMGLARALQVSEEAGAFAGWRWRWLRWRRRFCFRCCCGCLPGSNQVWSGQTY